MKVIKNKKYAYFSLAILLAGTLLYIFPPHFSSSLAEGCTTEGEKLNCTGEGTTSGDWQWSVNVQEVLSMDITQPSATGTGATGDVNKFLRDKYTLKVTSNNGKGYTAGMTTKTTDTNLAHTTATLTATQTIPTLGSSDAPKCADADCTAFVANHWGYSLDETTDTATPTGTYKALVGSNAKPITILSNATANSGTKDVYFGAKADTSKASGTYKGTVVFTVTSGTNGSDLPAASDPGAPEGPSAGDSPAESPSMEPSISYTPSTYTYTTNNRTYRSTASSVAAATPATSDTEENQKKRTTASDFVSPLGANDKTSTTSNIQHSSAITTGLTIVAFVAAGVGIFFFVLAKRDTDNDDDDIQQV